MSTFVNLCPFPTGNAAFLHSLALSAHPQRALHHQGESDSIKSGYTISSLDPFSLYPVTKIL